MKNLLITGATGFIGSHLVETALQKGYRVFCVVRATSDLSVIDQKRVHLIKADLSNFEELKKAFAGLNHNFDYLIHAAGMTKGKNLDEFMQANYKGTEHLLSALQNSTHLLPKKLIFLSSLAAAGPTALGSVIQINANKPITDYGKSKLAAEAIIQKSNIPYITLRPTAVYGPREKDIFTLFKILKKGINPVIGFHKQELTFIYVKDLVELIFLGLDSETQNETFFISDGKVYDKLQLAQYIESNLKKRAIKITLPLWFIKGMAFFSEQIARIQSKYSPLNLQKYRELKAASWACEVQPTFQAFDYQPQYDLQRGVEETTKWYLKEKWI